MSKRKYDKYIDDEASDGSSEFSDEAELSDYTEPKPKSKVLSNKTIDPKSIPPKPTSVKAKASRPYEFRMNFTNAQFLRKFLEPVAHSVKKMRFILCQGTAFTGFTMEAHAQDFTLANKSKFECDVEGTIESGTTSFCVNTSAFMQALNASALKDTTVSISKYLDTIDSVTFESINNESDVKTVYTCSLVESSQVESLSFISLTLGFHVNVHLTLLKDLILNARKCGANTLLFELWQSEPIDSIVHSKMSIGFRGIETSGTHMFFLSAKRIEKDGVVAWEPQSIAVPDDIKMEKKCNSEYDNNKLRLFVNHIECSWVLVHLSNEKQQEPLVLEFVMGGRNTKHIVMIGPKTEES
jgi:hypothetical protein